MRCPGGSNTGATKPNSTRRCFYGEKSNSTCANSHGFEGCRTLSYSPQRAQNMKQSPYFLTVTLNVPTLPLLSNVRREIVCSPGPRCPKSTE